MRRVLVVTNGAAGGGRASARFAAVRAGLGGLEVREAPTDGPGHATRLAADADADAVVAVGGDGTVQEVVAGLMARAEGARPALGIVPVGTGNSFVRDLGSDGRDFRDPAVAVAAIARGESRPVDVLALRLVDGREVFGVNLVSLGFAAEAGAKTNARYKPFGVAGYVGAVLETIGGLRPAVAPFALDGGAFDSRPFTLLSLSNSTSTGGDMRMAPAARIDDGLVDVVRVGPMGRRRLLGCFPRIFSGTHGELPEVSFATAREVAFAPGPPQPVMVDGEIVHAAPAGLRVLRHALRVLA